jgi:hypothetical protein
MKKGCRFRTRKGGEMEEGEPSVDEKMVTSAPSGLVPDAGGSGCGDGRAVVPVQAATGETSLKIDLPK